MIMSELKSKLIEEYLAQPLKKGAGVYVEESLVGYYKRETPKKVYCLVAQDVQPGDAYVSVIPNGEIATYGERQVLLTDVEISTDRIGYNPINSDVWDKNIRFVNFDMANILSNLGIYPDSNYSRQGSIIFGVEVPRLNWNPFVFNKKKEKEYYQRGFVWTLEQKQLLLESIYQGIECGRILVRKRKWNWLETMVKKGETEVAFMDIVDGKQRLHAIIGFMKNKFPDSCGYYYDDFSELAKRKLVSHQLFGYAEAGENFSDQDTIEQFLRLNFTGVPQSKEHIEFVQAINKRL